MADNPAVTRLSMLWNTTGSVTDQSNSFCLPAGQMSAPSLRRSSHPDGSGDRWRPGKTHSDTLGSGSSWTNDLPDFSKVATVRVHAQNWFITFIYLIFYLIKKKKKRTARCSNTLGMWKISEDKKPKGLFSWWSSDKTGWNIINNSTTADSTINHK